MKLAGFDTSNKVKNLCSTQFLPVCAKAEHGCLLLARFHPQRAIGELLCKSLRVFVSEYLRREESSLRTTREESVEKREQGGRFIGRTVPHVN